MDPETNTAPSPETTPPTPVETPVVPPPEPQPAKRARKEAETPKPSLGRMVHYVIPDGCANAGDHRPAIIVRVWPDTVNLQVFFDGDGTPHLNDGQLNTLWKLSVPYSAEPKAGTWHWPERE